MKILSSLGKEHIIFGLLTLMLLVVSIAVVVISMKSPNKKTMETEILLTEVAEERPTATEILEELTAEEYYEEELALDEDESNVLYEEETSGEGEGNTSQETVYPYYIKVNRQANCVTVYGLDENGEYTVPVKAMVCSVGLNGNTPLGVFKTSTKYLWRALYGGVYGQYAFRITGAILFHSVPYYTQDKGDLEAEEYNKLGEAASLGCVRLAVADAKWLVDNCPQGTMVEIYDSPDPGPLGKPSARKIDLSSPYRGWDPTDPDENNPWKAIIEAENAAAEAAKNSNPVISGVKDRTIERGAAIDLMEGVSAVDGEGNPVSVSVSGTVNTQAVGSYTVTYTAEDRNGRKTTATATITVRDTAPPSGTEQEETDNTDGEEDAAGGSDTEGDTSGSETGGDTSGSETGGDTSGSETGGDTSGSETGGDTSGSETGGDTSGGGAGGDTSDSGTGGGTSGSGSGSDT